MTFIFFRGGETTNQILSLAINHPHFSLFLSWKCPNWPLNWRGTSDLDRLDFLCVCIVNPKRIEYTKRSTYIHRLYMLYIIYIYIDIHMYVLICWKSNDWVEIAMFEGDEAHRCKQEFHSNQRLKGFWMFLDLYR